MEVVHIPLEGSEEVTGEISLPETHQAGTGTGIIFAHGAGNDMHNPLLVSVSEGLANEGYLSLRFNFPYKEKGKKAPDRPEVLISSWKSAYQFLNNHPLFRPERIIAAGKSMGGRIASQIIAERQLTAAGLIFLGYPLHPPGKPEKKRDAHLYKIQTPMLFFAGSRDPLCNLEQLKGVLSKITSPWHLEVIEGGDHSFHIPKSFNIPPDKVYSDMAKKIIDWLKGIR